MRIRDRDANRERSGAPAGAQGPYTAEELAAYEALVEKYGRHVYNVAYRMTGSDADAKDLAQEAFIRVFRAFRRIDPASPLEGWLYRIVSNLRIDLLRKQPKARVESIDVPTTTAEGGEIAREFPAPPGDNPETVIDRRLDGRIQQALVALPGELRMVVVLSDVEGYAYEEIAQALSLPLGTVKSRLHRARKILQERLATLQEERRGTADGTVNSSTSQDGE